MTNRSLRAALVSTDVRFRDLVREVCAAPDLGVAIGVEVVDPFAEFGEEQVRSIRKLNPELVFLDLEDDAELGVKFTQFLAEMNPAQRVIAAGPDLSPELLLSAMRAGVADYLHKPVHADPLREAILRVGQLLGRTPGKQVKPGQVYSVFSPKGGSGSTTVATNLAVILHRLTGKRTLLVDLDLELGEVAVLLGIQPRFNFVDLVQNFHRMDADLLASYIEQHEAGVHVLSAPFHPERTEVVSGDEFRRILAFLRQHYEYVVVDTPKTFSPATMAAFDLSDLVFLVTTLDLPSLRNIQRGLPMLKRVLRGGEQQLRLLVNRYDAENDITTADVERALGLKVYRTLSNDYEAVSRSLNTGKPIVLNGNSKYSRDLKALGTDLAGIGVGGRERAGLRKWAAGLLRRSKESD